jgi:DNA repair exonuclease SbcCD ATPase subunit
MVQREGRILRQGNTNAKVELFRYITEGSFDAYSWQLLETKQRFISDLLSGMAAERSSEDIDDVVLKYAEVKALAVGNPLVKQRVEAANEVVRYQILQRKARQKLEEYRSELERIPARETELQELIAKCEEDGSYYQGNQREYTAEERREFRELAFAAAHPEEPTREEQVLTEYQGFSVIVPAHATKENPVLYLRRSGNYVIYVGKSDAGLLVRIDNCLDELGKRLETLTEERERLRQRRSFLEGELAAPEDYADQILAYKKQLLELDEQLGVETEGDE